MPGEGGDIPPADGGRGAVKGRQRLDFRREHSGYGRCSDEGHRHPAPAVEVADGREAAELAAVGVAPDRHGKRAEPPLGACLVSMAARVVDPLREQDQPRAGREYGKPAVDRLFERSEERSMPWSRSAGCRISKTSAPFPRQYASISANAPWTANTPTFIYFPRSSMIVSISSALMPTIAGPRFSESFARSFESCQLVTA